MLSLIAVFLCSICVGMQMINLINGRAPALSAVLLMLNLAFAILNMMIAYRRME